MRHAPAPTGGMPGGPQGIAGGTGAPQGITPLDAPSQRPYEPVTTGAAAGPGPGPEIMP